MIKKCAAFISLTVVFSGSFALNTQPAEAKTSRNSLLRATIRATNDLVPPPPPYIPTIVPSMVPSGLGMTNAQAVSADDAVVKKPVNNKSNYILARNQVIEKRILNQIDSFDNKISSHEKEICKLLNL